MRYFFCVIGFLFFGANVSAQQYTLNGNATQDNCHCYTLTRAVNAQSGSVWNNYKIDLNNSFNFVFTVNLGSNDAGADGIAFVLQPISTSVGTSGSGLGFQGITPSIGVTLDTYQNTSPDNDPAYDHIAIQSNGDLNHLSSNNLAGPVRISSVSDNVEDGADHSLRIIWDAGTKTLSTYFDEVFRVSVVNDLVNTTFAGNSMVYWGFTGSTGGANNLQRFCTALNPNWHVGPLQKRCLGEPITFYDSTISFTTISKFYWDFGDGSPIDSVNLNPTHTYISPGDYTLMQKVIGADGCEETNTQTVRIGSKPVAGFMLNDSCIGNTISFTDTSFATVGTINNWYWDLDNTGITSTQQYPSTNYASYGIKNIKLVVKSIEGCESDTLIKPIRIRAVPLVDFTFTDSVCLGTATSFFENVTTADGLPVKYEWQLDGSSNISTDANPQYTFLTPGNHTVLLISANGLGACFVGKQKNVFVTDKPKAAIKAVSICQMKQVQLQDSSYTTDGLTVTGWWWDLGNGQFSFQKNPIANYTTSGQVTIKHVAYDAKGCISDTLLQNIYVNEKPVANFGFSEPVCNNQNLNLYDSSTVNIGSISKWEWINKGTIFSMQQNPINQFTQGANTVKLVVISAAGCISDTVQKSFIIKTKLAIDINYKDACKLTPVIFSSKETTTNIGVKEWYWDFGDGATGIGSTTTHSFTANKNYDIKLYAISSEGCSSDILTGKINIYGTNAFAGNDTIATAGQPVQLHASGGLSYLWIQGNQYLNSDMIANPVATLNATQTFRLKAFTPEGCESYDDVTVKIYKGPDIYLPNAFTPNGDGLNDIFKGTLVGLKQFNYMRIFNRWGQQIFATTTPNYGWDGRYNGINQPAGVYVVIIGGIDFKGKIIEKKATVQLIR